MKLGWGLVGVWSYLWLCIDFRLQMHCRRQRRFLISRGKRKSSMLCNPGISMGGLHSRRKGNDHWKLSDWQGLFSTFCLIHGLVTRIARESLLSLSLSLFNRVNHDRPVFDAREGFNMRLLDRKDQASLQTKIFICMYLYIFFNKLQLNSTLIFPEDSTRKIATRSWFSMETIA